MSFSVAQVFFLDPALVASSSSVGITKIDLFFKSKPQATNNKSGINNPGVQVFLTGTANSVPVLPSSLSNMQWTRAEYADVVISADATLATTFTFNPPVPFNTNQQIAFLLQYDGDEDFVPWTDKAGDYLIGTTTVSGGATSQAVGTYYSFISAVPVGNAVPSNTNMISVGTTNTISSLPNSSYTSTSWTPLTGTALKFNVKVARYSVNGNTALSGFTSNSLPTNAQITSSTFTTVTANGEYIINLPQDRYEYIAYDRVNSSILNISPGERCFPVLPFYPPGSANLVTLNCAIGSNVVVATGNVNFSTLLNTTANQPENFIITSQNALGANADIVNVRTVTSILSNTSVQFDQPLSFTNSVAVFYRAPVAVVDQFKRARFFGADLDVVILKGSTANSSMRFTHYSVANVTLAGNVTGTGIGYANTDYVIITGFSAIAGKILGTYSANAFLTTNANGSITNVYLANVGAGFSNTANVSYRIANSSAANSVGTGANLAITIGTNLKTEFLGFSGKGGNFKNTHPINIEVGQVLPGLLINTPPGTIYSTTIRYPYYSVDDATVPSGRVTYCDADNNWDILNVQTFSIHNPYEFSKRRVLPSWSNELFIPYANGTNSGGLGGSGNGAILNTLTSNASVIAITTYSNNDFSHVSILPGASKITYQRYIINNDYTGENTNYGNSWAKGIEVRFNLANNALAEDMIVYSTVYQPANTKVLAFVKLYNTHDNDSFDTKDWTMMQITSGNNIVSSPTNLNDTFELTFGLQPYPNLAFSFTGSVTTTNGSQTITGSGTTWSTNTTANLVSGDMVVIQNNLFSNNYMVAIVNAVTNNTILTINRPISNLNLVGTGFLISKVAFKYQAFSNYLNENVSRYYSSTLTENDGFNSAAIKLVLQSANGLSVPIVTDVRAIAVSA